MITTTCMVLALALSASAQDDPDAPDPDWDDYDSHQYDTGWDPGDPDAEPRQQQDDSYTIPNLPDRPDTPAIPPADPYCVTERLPSDRLAAGPWAFAFQQIEVHLAQESSGDEPYLMVLGFESTLGEVGSTRLWSKEVFEIDTSMHATDTAVILSQMGYLDFGVVEPDVDTFLGVIALPMEHDSMNWSDVREMRDVLADEVEDVVRTVIEGDRLDLCLLTELNTDTCDPDEAAELEAICDGTTTFEDYFDAVKEAVVATVSFGDWLQADFDPDDPIGDPIIWMSQAEHPSVASFGGLEAERRDLGDGWMIEDWEEECAGGDLEVHWELSSTLFQSTHELGDASEVWLDGQLRRADANADGRHDLVFLGAGFADDESQHAGLQVRTKLAAGRNRWIEVVDEEAWGAEVLEGEALVADLDADCQEDLVFLGHDWGGAGLNMRTLLSRGTGHFSPQENVFGDTADVLAHPPLVGDFDGDERDEIAVVGQDWAGTGLNIRTYGYDGPGLWTWTWSGTGDGPEIHDEEPLVADVDGDGADDILFVRLVNSGLELRTKRSNRDGSWDSWHDEPGIGGTSFFVRDTLVGDVDEDDDDDLVFTLVSDVAVTLVVLLSNGDGSWGVEWSQTWGSWAIQGDRQSVLSDLNGDGHLDVQLVDVGVQGGPAGNLYFWPWLGDGTGDFTPQGELSYTTPGAGPPDLLLGEFTDDGRHLDAVLVVTGTDGVEVRTLVGDGVGGFGI